MLLLLNFPISHTTAAAIFVGFILDCLLGDPQNPLHPVRMIGGVISQFVKLYHRITPKKDVTKLLFGVVMTVTVVFGSYFFSVSLLNIMYHIHFILGFAFEAILCYFMIAARSLCNEGLEIQRVLIKNDISHARKRLSYIVGRDTNNLNEEKIITATIETIAENLSDGVIAPLFYMFIGGIPLGVAYKAVNTLDSMVGYHNDTYAYLGKFAARLDDIVNLIPARLSAILMILASFFSRKNVRNAIRIYCRDRYNHLSPNSAHTEAVCAGALGLQLGGGSIYNGKLVEKPTIGDEGKKPKDQDIQSAVILLYISSIEGFLLGNILLLLITGGFHV